MPVCVLFVSSMSGIVFSSSAGAITDHNQSAKDIETHFKSQIYVDDPAYREPVLILPNALSKPERTTEIKFPSWVGFEPITY